MKINSIKLIRYKLLHLLDDSSIVIDDIQDQMMIAGLNGLGKTVTLTELSPLPPNNMRLFNEGGYKEIAISHQGKEYRLTNYAKGSAGKHSFIVDGVELNTGGTQSVQYQLVEEHFNYTRQIHDILVGRVKFTTMSPSLRREWFNKLSKSDSEFITKLWDKIRSGQRDNTGALKNIESKIAEHMTELLSDDELRSNIDDLEMLETNLSKLLTLKGQYPLDEYKTTDSLDILSYQIDTLVKQHSKLVIEYNHKYPDGLDDSLYNGLTAELNVLQANLVKDKQQLSVYMEDKQKIDHEAGTTNTDIDQYIQEIAHQLSSIDTSSYQSYLDRLGEVIPSAYLGDYLKRCTEQFTVDEQHKLTTLLSDTSYIELGYIETVSVYHKLAEDIKLVSTKLESFKDRLASNRSHLLQLNNSPNHTCPKCSTVFKDSSIVDIQTKLEQDITKLTEVIAKGEDKLSQLQSQYTDLTNTLTPFKYLLDYLYNERHLINKIILSLYIQGDSREEQISFINSHLSQLSVLGSLRDIVLSIYNYYHLTEQYTKLLKLKEDGKLKTSAEYLSLLSRIEQLESRVEDTIRQIATIKTRLATVEEQMRFKDKLDTLYKEIEDTTDRYQLGIDSSDRVRYQQHIEMMHITIQTEISRLRKLVQHQSGISYIIKHLEENKSNLLTDIDTHKRLMDILNPKDGLIAKSIVGFIRQYIRDMNTYIQQVWSYPLVIDIADDDSFTTDYKFPVKVGEEDGRSDDVFLTSQGQSEIIDFTFKLTMMSYLGLDRWSLYADELGGALNTSHRYNLYNLIKRLQDEQRIGQLFVITHLNDIHQLLTRATTVELLKS